jgi:WD40 repeat protein
MHKTTAVASGHGLLHLAHLVAKRVARVDTSDVRTGRPISSIRRLGHVTGLLTCTSPDGKALLAVGHSERTWVYAARTGENLSRLGRSESPVAALRHAGRTLLVTVPLSHRDGFTVWDALSAEPVAHHTGTGAPLVACAAFAGPDDHPLFAVGTDTSLQLYDMLTGRRYGALMDCWPTAVAAVPSPDGTDHLVTGERDGSVTVWQPDLRAPAITFDAGAPVRSLAAVGHDLAVATGEGVFMVGLRL